MRCSRSSSALLGLFQAAVITSHCNAHLLLPSTLTKASFLSTADSRNSVAEVWCQSGDGARSFSSVVAQQPPVDQDSSLLEGDTNVQLVRGGIQMYSCPLPQCDVGNTFKVERKGELYRLETPVTFSGTQEQILYLLVDLIQGDAWDPDAVILAKSHVLIKLPELHGNNLQTFEFRSPVHVDPETLYSWRLTVHGASAEASAHFQLCPHRILSSSIGKSYLPGVQQQALVSDRSSEQTESIGSPQRADLREHFSLQFSIYADDVIEPGL